MLHKTGIRQGFCALPLQEATCTALPPRPWALPLELGLAHEHRHTGRQGTASGGTGEPGTSCSRAFSRGGEHSASSREKTRHPCCRYGPPRAVQESQPKGRRPGRNAGCAQRRAGSAGTCAERASPAHAQRTPPTLASTRTLTCFSGRRAQGPAWGSRMQSPRHTPGQVSTHTQRAGRARHAGKRAVSRLRVDGVRLHQGKC